MCIENFFHWVYLQWIAVIPGITICYNQVYTKQKFWSSSKKTHLLRKVLFLWVNSFHGDSRIIAKQSWRNLTSRQVCRTSHAYNSFANYPVPSLRRYLFIVFASRKLVCPLKRDKFWKNFSPGFKNQWPLKGNVGYKGVHDIGFFMRFWPWFDLFHQIMSVITRCPL